MSSQLVAQRPESRQKLVNVRTLAARYDVHVSTVWRWVTAKRIPEPTRIGRKCTRWDVHEVDAALARAGERGAA